jgi:transcriptional regulator GlxA family with amidase domain
VDPRQVVVVAYDGAELVDIACVTTALFMAGQLGADPPYRVRLASQGGGMVRAVSGLDVVTQARLQDIDEDVDTLLVSGGLGHEEAAASSALVGHVRRLATRSRRVASVCTGATVLAEAGLLDGRRASTHWMYAHRLAARYPRVRVDASPIFVRDGGVASSGGVTAALDLTLAFIEEDHGAELARSVAAGMVTYLQRPGNQAQMSVFTTAPRPHDALVRRSLEYAIAHVGDDLATTVLAAHAGVSVRHLRRLFATHLGESPAAAVRRVRLEVAARMLTGTDLSLSQIARRCGYSSAETLRQAFVASLGTTPSRFRAAHSTSRGGTRA